MVGEASDVEEIGVFDTVEGDGELPLDDFATESWGEVDVVKVEALSVV